MAKLLNVTPTNIKELTKKWGFRPIFTGSELYIRCNKNGDVNWDIAPVYTKQEIDNHKNAHIIE